MAFVPFEEVKLARLATKIRKLHKLVVSSELAEQKFRNMAATRRLEMGRLLRKARENWPARGPKAKGWGKFLAICGVDQDVALDAMKYAGYVEEKFPGEVPGNLPTLAEAGLDNRPKGQLMLPPGSEPDRDTWCTPKFLTDALGQWDLDPCANERSHVHAKRSFQLERGEDGLKLAATIKKNARVFINPPYSDVMPWVEAYAHTRFCFLLKVDASTKWFAKLHENTQLICVPRGTRIEFEPPPGVDGDSNQFPHALFFARESDANEAVRKLSYVWKVVR